jgi:hypothetical protein
MYNKWLESTSMIIQNYNCSVQQFYIFLGDTITHKVRTYKEYHSVCPSSELGLSQPLSRRECSPPPRNRGRWHTSLRVGGWGGVPIPTRGIHYGTLYMYVLCAITLLVCFMKIGSYPGLARLYVRMQIPVCLQYVCME